MSYIFLKLLSNIRNDDSKINMLSSGYFYIDQRAWILPMSVILIVSTFLSDNSKFYKNITFYITVYNTRHISMTKKLSFFPFPLLFYHLVLFILWLPCRPLNSQHEPLTSASLSGCVLIIELIIWTHRNAALMAAASKPAKPAMCPCSGTSYMLLPSSVVKGSTLKDLINHCTLLFSPHIMTHACK